MQHPDEGTIHAWLDGALSPAEASEVETHAAGCAQCRDAVAEARGLIAASSRIVSALDVVPAGVIPARKTAGRPWYTSTQLRAAAAVVFVAGASFALLRTGDKQSVAELSQRVTSDAAITSTPAEGADQAAPEAAASTQEDFAAKSSTSAAPKNVASSPVAQMSGPATANRRAATGAATGASGNLERDEAEARRAPPAVAPAPALAAPPLAPLADSAVRSGVAKSIPLENVVVTGVAQEAVPANDLRIIAVDSTAVTRTTRYRIASGAEVTLVEDLAEFSGRGAVARERAFDGNRPPAPPPPPPLSARADAQPTAVRSAAVSAPPVTSITWTDPATRRSYRLSGRVSKETLEAVKAKIQGTKR